MQTCCCAVDGDWSSTPEGAAASIPSLYFCESKLVTWSNIADHATEACCATREVVGRYFDPSHHGDVVSQLVGTVSRQNYPFSRCLQLLELLEISWNLKLLPEILEISRNLVVDAPGKFYN